jgi:hypothetical protein
LIALMCAPVMTVSRTVVVRKRCALTRAATPDPRHRETVSAPAHGSLVVEPREIDA